MAGLRLARLWCWQELERDEVAVRLWYRQELVRD